MKFAIRSLCTALILALTVLLQGGPIGLSAQGFQQPAEPKPDAKAVLQVMGEVAHPLTFSAADFAKFEHRTVVAKAHDGMESKYEGVALADILAKAGAPGGPTLRGPAMVHYVLIEAEDNYRVVFSLAELDSAFTDRVIILADRRDGKPLSAREGPLQVIVPGEKKHARWVRQVVRLRVGRG